MKRGGTFSFIDGNDMRLQVGAAVSIGTTLYSTHEAKKNSKRASASMDKQTEVMQEQLDLARSQWESYRDNIMPLEIEASRLGISAQELALQRGERDFQLYQDYYAPLQEQFADEAQTLNLDRVARDAAVRTDKDFELQSQIADRDLQRMGLRPDSGRARGDARGRELTQAAARSFNINAAVEGERDKRFSRIGAVLGRTPGAQGPSMQIGAPGLNPSSAAATFGNVASGYGHQADAYGRAAGGAMSGGIDLGNQLYNTFKNVNFGGGGFNNYSTTGQGGGSYTPYAGNNAADNFSNMDFDDINAFSTQFKDGGLVRGPQGTDKVPARLTSGEFVIPKDVVDVKGTEFFQNIVDKYHDGGLKRGK